MVDSPCSRIGHIYKHNPFPDPRGGKDYLSKNFKRVAEVWMVNSGKCVLLIAFHNKHFANFRMNTKSFCISESQNATRALTLVTYPNNWKSKSG